jgi:sugar lactone lactonase YvrE
MARNAVEIADGIAVRALAIDANADLYLTASNAPNRLFALPVLEPLGTMNRAAKLELVAGSGNPGSLGDGGAALDAELDLKTDSLLMRSGIAIAPDGTLFIADTGNDTIRRVAGPESPEPGIIRNIAGRLVAQQNASLVEPMGISVDRGGNLYIADRGANALVVLQGAADSPAGALQTLADVVSPAIVAAAPDSSEVFVASPETGGVFVFNPRSHLIQVVGDYIPHAPDKESLAGAANMVSCGHGSAEQACPTGLAVDGGGNLFISDSNTGQIVRVDAKTGKTKAVASNLSAPGEIIFDTSGNLYVAEQGRSRLLKYPSLGQSDPVLTIVPPAALPPPPAPRVCPAPGPGVPADAFNFCDQPTGGVTQSQTFKLIASADVNGLVFTTFTGANPSDFTVAGSTCTATLTVPPGSSTASCLINIVFTPQAAGSRSATLSVTDSASDTATADVTGTGDDFQLQLASNQTANVAVVQGGEATFTLQAVPDAVFGGTVTLACPAYSSLPSYTTCAISPTSVTLTPGGTSYGTPVAFQVAFQTSLNSPPPTYSVLPSGGGSRPSLPRGPLRVPVFPALPAIGALAMLLVLARRKGIPSEVAFTPRTARRIWASALVGAAMAALLVGGCGNSNSSKTTVTTPAGSTQMSIQATAQGAARGITITLRVNTAP